MAIRYVLMDPVGNITALVESTVPVEQQLQIATQIMAKEPTCEQVGFVMPTLSDCDTVIRMAGGEFCGNASMCAAVRHCIQAGEEKKTVLRVCVSNTVVAVEAMPVGQGYSCCVGMPHPIGIETVALNDISIPVVHFEGISHGILPLGMEKDAAESCLRRLCNVLQVEAAGLMLLDSSAEHMVPLVYVPGIHTMFWEGACGSGSSAVGAYLAHCRKKAVSLSLCQPGGTLHVEAAPDGVIHLSGMVRVLYEKTI